MERIKWYFPETIEEAVTLLDKKKNAVFHAGGTTLALQGIRRRKGFIDLGRMPLKQFNNSGGNIDIGAMQTFSDIAENMKKADPQSILCKSPEYLPPALRNRITVGGSVALFPHWSDIMGPLIALDAEVVLAGKNAGAYGVAQFAGASGLKEKSLITGIRFKSLNFDSHYFRASRTCFDYSCFNISILMRKKPDGIIEDLRIVVVGCKEKFKRLGDIEAKFIGKNAENIDIVSALQGLELEFHSKKLGSPAYLKHLAVVELERGLNKVVTKGH